MQLSIESLRQTGNFTGEPVKKTIQWSIGDEEYEADVYVRKLSYKSAVIDAVAISEGGDLPASRIAYCIVDEKGAPVFTVADVTGVNPDGSPVCDEVDGKLVTRGCLNDSLANALYEAILEVNPVGKPKRVKKTSRRKTSSGTS